MSDALNLREDMDNNQGHVVYTITDIYLIAVIRITLDLKLNPTPINILILGLAKNLRVNLIELIEQYTTLYPMYNTNNRKIDTAKLIDLIPRVYDGTAEPQEEEELNKILSL